VKEGKGKGIPKMDGDSFLVHIRINNTFTHALIDNGCTSSANLREISSVTYGATDVHGHQQERIYLYVIPGQTEDVILGNEWMKDVDARYSSKAGY